jgi:ornithine carbamoyltransferase
MITTQEWTKDELDTIIDVALDLKRKRALNEPHALLRDKVLAMLFFFSSTRTRASFEAGMAQLGGSAMFLSPRDTQLGRGEPIEDTARVLSRMVDCVMIRTFDHADLERFAAHSRVPVINGLTDLCHPCQLLADMQTFAEHRGDIAGRTVTWVGDGNNMCNSYIGAARQFDFELRIACPEGYEPEPDILGSAAERCAIWRDPQTAVEGADLVVTDTWISMGQEEEKARRERAFAGYMVHRAMLARAAPDALFLHCLPAYRGKEVAADVLDAPDSAVWDEAENRMHAQKALLEFLLG